MVSIKVGQAWSILRRDVDGRRMVLWLFGEEGRGLNLSVVGRRAEEGKQ